MTYCQSIISDQFLSNMVCYAINDNLLNIFIWFSFKKIHLKMSSTKCWPFCSCFNVLPHWGRVMHICSKPDHHRFREYRQISNISCTKSQNLNVSHLALQLSLPNPLKPGVKSRMKMQLEQYRQAMLKLHQIDCLLRCGLYQRFDSIFLPA